MNPSPERFDTLVIGAGFSGLAAGIRLALAGQRVAVLERHYLWGGLNSFYKRGGRLFDSGLHALTNFVPKGTRGTPLARVLRQLRIGWDELALREQKHSEIYCAGERVRFSNQLELLIEEIGRVLPGSKDRFVALAEEIRNAPLELGSGPVLSARAELDRRFGEPLLTDLMLLPCCYYGSAQEHDVEWDQFQILFRSIFLEGLSLPAGGARGLLELFIGRLKGAGGELRLKSEVQRILVQDGRARGVELVDGRRLEAEQILSSAGYVESLALAGVEPPEGARAKGQLSFVETISVLDRHPHLLGTPERPMDAGVIFFSTGERFLYERPKAPCDLTSGVISMPTNFQACPADQEGLFRVTVLANHAAWIDQPEEHYRAQKAHWSQAALEATEALCAPVLQNEVFRDSFTPRTIRHYTAHQQGAIYGSPLKQKSGRTPIEGLYLIGTDQGFLGIVGACVSGIAMANLYALARA